MNDKTNSQRNEDSVSRRKFLKSTSTAVVGGSLLSSLAIKPGLFADHHDEVKVALIGCGGRGSGAADQALNTYDQGPIKLVAMADAFRDRLDGSFNNLHKKHGDRVAVPEGQKFIGFDAYKQAIELADVVILATPPGFRPIHFEEAVKQGKNIFMEKPVATDPAGVRKVLAAAKEAKKKNLKVGVGLQRHHQAGLGRGQLDLHSFGLQNHSERVSFRYFLGCQTPMGGCQMQRSPLTSGDTAIW